MDDGLYEKLVVLNNVYNNTLIPSKELIQLPVIKTQLFPHQITMVNAMHKHRDKMIHGFLLENQAINGKIGIVGDTYGMGKTLSVLAYLASQHITPKITCELTDNSSRYFFSHELYKLSNISTNLIIVPHSLFNQWSQEIAKHTTMVYVPIETKRSLRDESMVKNIMNSNFVLTTNKCYKFIQEYATKYNIEWNNIFIDEASSIYFNSSDPPLKFQFLWFITNNWIPLLFKNPSISKNSYLKNRIDMHPDLEKWIVEDTSPYMGILTSYSFLKEYLSFYHENRGLIVLRNSYDSKIDLPIINEIIQCQPNISMNSLISYYLTRNAEPRITSNKILNLFQALDVDFKDIEDYMCIQSDRKHDVIDRKYKENECVICLETCEYPTIVNCCYNIYCGKCLLNNMIITHKCPTCREVLLINNICCLQSLNTNVVSKSKIEICLDILNNNRNGKFIIYSSFNNIFYKLFEEIDKLGLKAERIDNGLFSLIKIVKNFNKGDTHIIFISNIDVIRGLSLESTSHLIFYHDQPVYELKQILIHAGQRIGRQTPLKIIHLHSEIQF